MASSIIVVGQNSGAGLYVRPLQRSQALSWNPIANLSIVSKGKANGICSFNGNRIRVLQTDGKSKRNSLVVYANVVPGAPVPSGPPSSSSMSWFLGFVVSFILPFFTNKWGPLWVVKNRIMDSVQTFENIVEAVEKAAETVDKIAEDIAEDLPEGSKLRDLVEIVEHAAEQTAKTADCIDNVIDTFQEAEEHMEEVVESIAKEAHIKDDSPKEANQ